MKPYLLFLSTVLLCSPARGQTPIEWSKRMADSQIARFGDDASYKAGGKWDYALHVTLLGMLELSTHTGDPKYADFVKNSTGTWIRPDGTIEGYKIEDYNIDNIAPGRTLIALQKLTGEERYKTAAATLRSQLDKHPRTIEGGFWHKKRYTSQMWLDGLYMGQPFYAKYTQTSAGGNDAWDDIAKQFRLIDQHLYNADTGLYYHGWDEAKVQNWANKQTGRSANFWGRSVGWWVMAQVETLEYFPKNHPARAELLAILKKTADGIVKCQDPATGLWWQVLDQGNRKGNYLEGTATAMFVYSLAKAVNDGILPSDYLKTARAGYEGMVRDLIRVGAAGDVNLTQCCQVAGLGQPDKRDGTYDYYISEPIVENDLKGVGPFIQAGIEFDQMGVNKENFSPKAKSPSK
ncbi:MAG: glycoside hydrolase family 88 protein [Verrucomicrobiota bacterium]